MFTNYNLRTKLYNIFSTFATIFILLHTLTVSQHNSPEEITSNRYEMPDIITYYFQNKIKK